MVYDLRTYPGLLAGVADWLNREDLTDQCGYFVQLAEAQFNRELRLRDMMVRAITTSNYELVALPDDFLEHYSLELAPGRPQSPLRYMSEKESNTIKAEARNTGRVYGYTLVNGAFELVDAPSDNVNLRMVYYAQIPALVSAVTGTNWLLTKSPDLYLFSALVEAAPYLNDDARLQTWSARRGKLIEDIKLESERALRPTSGMTARPRPFY